MEWRGNHWANPSTEHRVVIEMHEVASLDDLKNAGDYFFLEREEADPARAEKGAKYPYIVCPGCLGICNCANHTLVKESPLTITASVLHKKGDGSECWHGWVTDGKMS